MYAGGTTDVYVNPATVSGWIKGRGELGQMREMKSDNETVWNDFLSKQHQKEGRKEGRNEGRKKVSKK